MNSIEFSKIIGPVAEYYDRNLSESAVAVYFQLVKDLDAEAFQHMINLHMTDPEQGMYFPTMAHLTAQVSTSKDVIREAGIAFENNPQIDGTGGFDLNRESAYDREQRKRAYIDTQVNEWKSASVLERIGYSDRVPDNLKGELLMKLGHNRNKLLEDGTNG